MLTGCWKRRQTPLKKHERIWELDALRGICVLGMVAVHLVYDLTELYAVLPMPNSGLYDILLSWGGVVFFLISGICATLGTRSVRRGFTVFACGMAVTAVTYLADENLTVRFGVLHCLGICMILWHFLRGLPTAAMGAVAAVSIGLGLLFQQVWVTTNRLFWLGLVTPFFNSSDYFPLLPFLGFFLLGAIIGRILYKNKQTLLPRVNPEQPVIRFLRFCGRQSLLIYLLHQPVMMVLIESLL